MRKGGSEKLSLGLDGREGKSLERSHMGPGERMGSGFSWGCCRSAGAPQRPPKLSGGRAGEANSHGSAHRLAGGARWTRGCLWRLTAGSQSRAASRSTSASLPTPPSCSPAARVRKRLVSQKLEETRPGPTHLPFLCRLRSLPEPLGIQLPAGAAQGTGRGGAGPGPRPPGHAAQRGCGPSLPGPGHLRGLQADALLRHQPAAGGLPLLGHV